MSQFNSDCRYNIRLALTENYANAMTPQHVFEAHVHYERVYGARAEPVREVPVKRQAWKPTKINNSRLGSSALAVVGESSSPLCGRSNQHLNEPLPPQPSNQRDARGRPDWEQWVQAEQEKMKTCFEKGTFEIVDLPQGVLKLPSMFQYKLKLGPKGEFVKCKGCLCARGDLQQDHEYGETLAQTLRFSMVCLIIAITTQLGWQLFQFDIRSAFL
eukprot:3168523-Rhodomonas_salina.1